MNNTNVKAVERMGYEKALKDLDKIIVELEDQGVNVPVEIQDALAYICAIRYS